MICLKLIKKIYSSSSHRGHSATFDVTRDDFASWKNNNGEKIKIQQKEYHPKYDKVT